MVQDIFAWIKSGMSLDAISRRLNDLGIKSPLEYKQGNGEHFRCAFKKNECAMWSPLAVRRIAMNPVYTGMLVQGKIMLQSWFWWQRLRFGYRTDC